MADKKSINFIKLKIKLLKLNRIFSKRNLLYFGSCSFVLGGVAYGIKDMSLPSKIMTLPMIGWISNIIFRGILTEKLQMEELFNYPITNNKEKIIENIWHDLFLKEKVSDLNQKLKLNYRAVFLEDFDFERFITKSKRFQQLHQKIMQAYIDRQIIPDLIIKLNYHGISDYKKLILTTLLEAADFKINSKDQQKIRNKIDLFYKTSVENLILINDKNPNSLESETVDHLIKKCEAKAFEIYQEKLIAIKEYHHINQAIKTCQSQPNNQNQSKILKL